MPNSEESILDAPSFEEIDDPSYLLNDFNYDFSNLPRELSSAYKIADMDLIPLPRKKELLAELNMLLVSRKLSNNQIISEISRLVDIIRQEEAMNN